MGNEAQAAFVISWSQTEIDGLSGAPVVAIDRGATWGWQGEPVRIDTASVIASVAASDDEEIRRHVAAGARHLIGRALVQEGARMPFAETPQNSDRTFTVTEGWRLWTGTLIDMPELARPMILFVGEMPPPDTPLYVSEGPEVGWQPQLLKPKAEGVVCFTPGTRLATPEGMQPVEALVAGDLVYTKDDGPQEVLWIGHRHISGARLFAVPDLRPVRIRANAFEADRPEFDLIVSPDHRVLIEGPAALALWGEREVLVAARDLIDDRRVTRDRSARSVDYIHLMLPRHSVLFANGMETESFHPAGTDLNAVAPDQLGRLFDIMPDLEITPSAYGPLSRRVLGAADAELIQRVT